MIISYDDEYMTGSKKHSNGVSPLVAGAIGAVIGAGIAVAASAALKDEKTMKKAKEILRSLTNQLKEYLDRVKTNTEVKRDKSVKRLQTGKKQIPILANAGKKNDLKQDSK